MKPIIYFLNLVLLSASIQSAPYEPRFQPTKLQWSGIREYNEKITDNDIRKLNNFLQALYPSIKDKTAKTPLIFKAGINKLDFNIPRETVVASPDKIGIVLNEVIYEVKNTPKIIAAYDPVNKESLIKKLADKDEFGMYQYLAAFPLRGVVSTHIAVADGNDNIIFLKRYKDGDLDEILTEIYEGYRPEFTNDEKLKIIKTLLLGLSNLHEININFTRYNKTKSVPFSHRDLKPKNTFCEATNCVIGDFDLAFQWETISGTGGYLSPETLSYLFYNQFAGIKDDADFNITYGQKADLWTMGLIISEILSSKPGAQIFFNAVNKTQQYLNPNNKMEQIFHQKRYSPANFKELASEIENRKKLSRDPRIINAWSVVQKLLQRDPKSRIDAKTALDLLNK